MCVLLNSFVHLVKISSLSLFPLYFAVVTSPHLSTLLDPSLVCLPSVFFSGPQGERKPINHFLTKN